MTPQKTAKRSKTAGKEHWDFDLYVAGRKPRSLAAYENLEKICKEYLPGRYTITVIDLYKHPERAREADIAALPTLVRRLPAPIRRIIGDLSRTDDVLLALGQARSSDQ